MAFGRKRAATGSARERLRQAQERQRERLEQVVAATASRERRGETPVPEVEEFQRAIARTAWGAAWCRNLEAYGDYASRLPRGRTYLRARRVLSLDVKGGTVTSRVVGSDVYDVTIRIAPIAAPQWTAICRASAGTIPSVVALLRGELPERVMTRLCRQDDGLFPRPDEIRFACTCPDVASLCKHVAATLYAVGALFDTRPELLFTLRGVEAGALVAGAVAGVSFGGGEGPPANVLDGVDLGALFGVAIGERSVRSG